MYSIRNKVFSVITKSFCTFILKSTEKNSIFRTSFSVQPWRRRKFSNSLQIGSTVRKDVKNVCYNASSTFIIKSYSPVPRKDLVIVEKCNYIIFGRQNVFRWTPFIYPVHDGGIATTRWYGIVKFTNSFTAGWKIRYKVCCKRQRKNHVLATAKKQLFKELRVWPMIGIFVYFQ